MHIAIIGAGISGLMSALELVEQGCTISILINNKRDKQPLGLVEAFSLRCTRGAMCMQ